MVRKNPPHFKALTAVGALMTLINFTLSNVRRFYSSMGNPLAVKGLSVNFVLGTESSEILWSFQKSCGHSRTVYVGL